MAVVFTKKRRYMLSNSMMRGCCCYPQEYACALVQQKLMLHLSVIFVFADGETNFQVSACQQRQGPPPHPGGHSGSKAFY